MPRRIVAVCAAETQVQNFGCHHSSPDEFVRSQVISLFLMVQKIVLFKLNYFAVAKQIEKQYFSSISMDFSNIFHSCRNIFYGCSHPFLWIIWFIFHLFN